MTAARRAPVVFFSQSLRFRAHIFCPRLPPLRNNKSSKGGRINRANRGSAGSQRACLCEGPLAPPPTPPLPDGCWGSGTGKGGERAGLPSATTSKDGNRGRTPSCRGRLFPRNPALRGPVNGSSYSSLPSHRLSPRLSRANHLTERYRPLLAASCQTARIQPCKPPSSSCQAGRSFLRSSAREA